MKVTVPVTIDDAKLTSSTAVEPIVPTEWDSGTTYALGAIVKIAASFACYESIYAGSHSNKNPTTNPTYWRQFGSTETAWSGATTYAAGDTVSSAAYHRVYESLQAGNLNHAVPVPPETENSYWIDIGPTNKWAMLDLSRNTQTVIASPLTVEVAPGERINAVAALGLEGQWLSIKVTSAAFLATTEGTTYAGIIWPLPYDATRTYALNECVNTSGGTMYRSLADDNIAHTPASSPTYWSTTNSDGSAVTGDMTNLTTRQVLDHYMYAFAPFATRPGVVEFDIPPYSDCVVKVIVTSSVANCKCSGIVVGTYADIGEVQFTAESDAINFSTVDRDIYGTATLVKRRSVPKTSQTLMLDKTRIDYVYAIRSALNAVPALWTAVEDSSSEFFGMMLILGVYKRFTINAANASVAVCNLELEEI